MASNRAKASRYGRSDHGSAKLYAERIANADARVAYTRQWRNGIGRAKAAKWQSEYRQSEAARARRVANEAARRARMRSADMRDVSAGLIAELRQMPCAYCGGVGGHIDHGIPLAAGGLHAIDNLVPACRSCNGRKRMSLSWW